MPARPHLDLTLAMTGASGAPYALRLVRHFCDEKIPFAFLISNAGYTVLTVETGLSFTEFSTAAIRRVFGDDDGCLHYFAQDDWMAPIASGSNAPATMIVCPASGGFIGRVANGISSNLIERAADIQIKKRSEEHTSELQSHSFISYAVFCLKKKKKHTAS